MDHGGEAARPATTVGSTTGSGASDGQLGAAAPAPPPGSFSDVFNNLNNGARYDSTTWFAPLVRAVAAGPGRGEVRVPAAFHLHRRQPGPGDAVLVVGPHLPGGVVPPVHGSSHGCSALQPGRGVALADMLPGGGGAVDNGDHELLPSWEGRHGEVLVVVDLLPDDAGHGAAIVGQVPSGGVTAYDDYAYYALLPRPGADGHGEVLVDLHPYGAGHGEVFADLLPGGGGDGYYPWQPRPGAGRGGEFLRPFPDGVGVVFDGSGNFAQQALLMSTGRPDGISGAFRDLNLGAAGSDDVRGVVTEQYLRRLLPLAGIGACSVAVNGLAAAGPGSQAAAFDLFALLLGGLFLIILHVLRG